MTPRRFVRPRASDVERDLSDSDDDFQGGYVPRKRTTTTTKGLSSSARDAEATRASDGRARNDDDVARARAGHATTNVELARAHVLARQVSRRNATDGAALAMAEAGAERERECYVGNLVPGVVSASDVEALLNATMRAVFVTRANEGESVTSARLSRDGKYAFVTFREAAMAEACANLRGVDLCGRTLTFARPDGWKPGSEVDAAARKAEALMRDLVQTKAKAISTTKARTKAVRLRNLIAPESLDDDDEYKEVCEDVEEECRKCGVVEACVVPRRGDRASRWDKYAGDAVVLFADVDGATKAIKTMDGREFDGNKVEATYMDEVVFKELMSPPS